MGLPTKSKILNAWYDINTRTDFLFLKTNGKVRLADDIDRCWNCHRLENHPWYEDVHIERCHIIPKSKGGSDSPLNLVLLCSDCHRRSPDTTLPEILFEWFESEHDANEQYKQELITSIKTTFKFPEKFKNKKEQELIIKKIFVTFNTRRSKEFQDYYTDNSTNHFGVKYKVSTEIGLLKKYITDKKIFSLENLRKLK
jgi:hypothetical protein